MKYIKFVVVGLVTMLLLMYIGIDYTHSPERTTPQILSFEDCVRAGLPVQEKYPRSCATQDGRTYTEEIEKAPTYTNNASSNDIVISTPSVDGVTGKEFKVLGKARGYWFFEASFPIEVLDTNGVLLATFLGKAEGEWMTEEFVPFSADISIPPSYQGKVTLCLKKDNPSGLPEKDASVSFDINVEY